MSFDALYKDTAAKIKEAATAPVQLPNKDFVERVIDIVERHLDTKFALEVEAQ